MVSVICLFYILQYAGHRLSKVRNVTGLHRIHYLCSIMRKQDSCICKNKGADQMRGVRAADQRLYFCCIAGKIPLLPT